MFSTPDFKTTITFLCFFVAFPIVYFAYERSKNSRNPMENYRQKRRYTSSDGEKIFNLYFNDEETFSFKSLVPLAVSTMISFVIVRVLYTLLKIFTPRDFYKVYNSEITIVTSFFLLTLIYKMYEKNRKWADKIAVLRNSYRKEDLVFTKDGLKISPFLLQESKLNPEQLGKLTKLAPEVPNTEYVETTWEDLKEIRVVDKLWYDHEGDRQMSYQIHIISEFDNFILNRRNFTNQEPEFFDLILSYKNIEIINESRYNEPLKALPDHRKLMIFFGMTIYVILAIAFVKDS